MMGRRHVLVGALGTGAVLLPPTSSYAVQARPTGLARPGRKDIAMRLVSSAENSSLRWREQYPYLEDIGDGRGTA